MGPVIKRKTNIGQIVTLTYGTRLFFFDRIVPSLREEKSTTGNDGIAVEEVDVLDWITIGACMRLSDDNNVAATTDEEDE